MLHNVSEVYQKMFSYICSWIFN